MRKSIRIALALLAVVSLALAFTLDPSKDAIDKVGTFLTLTSAGVCVIAAMWM